ncbi:MAG TPA: hypothetical protein VFY66_09035 [Anaerolineales bacterium]|nr:hypothetical protein [Anaerolineales bacterium]
MRKRLPDFQSILQVYAVIAVMFAGWTLTAFLWKLSAWLMVLNLWEIITLFSYAMAANFLESLLILLLLLLVSALLPARFLLDDFVVRGTVLSIGLIGSLMAFVGSHRQFGFGGGLLLLIMPLAVLALMIFLLHRSPQYPRMRSAAMWLSDRVVVFLFILIPLFTVASVYVIFRNVG